MIRSAKFLPARLCFPWSAICLRRARRSRWRARVAGRVYLVGAGPGDPELLTLKAAKLLARADVVLYDSLVSREVMAMVSPAALLVDVGKRAGRKLLTQDEINSLLVSYAKDRNWV